MSTYTTYSYQESKVMLVQTSQSWKNTLMIIIYIASTFTKWYSIQHSLEMSKPHFWELSKLKKSKVGLEAAGILFIPPIFTAYDGSYETCRSLSTEKGRNGQNLFSNGWC